jgi:branched-chain amino acid transport system ATP-binding protein
LTAPLLTTRKLDAFYGDFQALFGVDLEVHAGEIVALVGANGAGKSTLLRTICGVLPARAEAVLFDGEEIGGLRPGRIVSRGIALVPEGRRLFASLSVEENLRMGAYARRPGRWNLAAVHALFPALRERRSLPATALSGGEQQMVAIGRALMSNPRLLLCDELSLGLAPVLVKEIYRALVDTVRREGLTALIVEQDVAVARSVSRRLLCMQEGRITLEGASADLSAEQVSRAYFGV